MKKLFTFLICLLQFTLSFGQNITTIAGNGVAGYSGDGASALSAEIYNATGVAVDGAGNIYIADNGNYCIRKVDVTTGNISTIAGNGTPGFSGDGGLATLAKMYPVGVVVDKAGNIYIADGSNQRIRKVDNNTGIINTIAGNGNFGYSGDGGPATSATLFYPMQVIFDLSGNLYIADAGNFRIRKVNVTTGVISTIAGNGTKGYSGDGSLATSAQLGQPEGIAIDGSGNLYIADRSNQCIRKVTISTGIITTIAGNGTVGYTGDGGSATSATLNNPPGVVVDKANNVYIADESNQCIRKVDALTGTISTMAGNGSRGYSGDGGPAMYAMLSEPTQIALDETGNVYIADRFNDRIRKIFNTVVAGIPDIQIQNSLLAYPNPFNSEIKLKCLLSQSGKLSIELLDLTGKIIFSLPWKHYSAGEQELTIPIDKNSLSSEIYLLRVNSESSSSLIKVSKGK